MKKRFAAILIVLTLLITVLAPTASATQSMSSNFSRNYTLTGNGATDIVAVALAQANKTGSQLGYKEAWCANFVSDCAKLAGQSSAIPADGYVPTLYTKVLNAGGSRVTSPRVGDLAIIDWNKGGRKCHVEIVYEVSGSTVKTIGGNTGSTGSIYSNKVTKRTGGYSVSNGIFTAFLRPKYSGGGNSGNSQEYSSSSYPVIGSGYSNPAGYVMLLQQELNYALTTNLAVDGSFGSNTKAAIEAYQRAKGLTVDGICGKNTWNALNADYQDAALKISFSPSSASLSIGEKKSISIGFSGKGIHTLNCSYDTAVLETPSWQSINWVSFPGTCTAQVDITGKASGTCSLTIYTINDAGGITYFNSISVSVGSGTAYANLGSDFYACIQKADAGVNLENSELSNVQVRSGNSNDQNNPRQIWHFVRESSGAYTITSCYDGMAMSATGSGTDNGTNIAAAAAGSGANQRWYLVSTGSDGYNIRSSYCSKVIDCNGNYSDPGTNVHLWENNGTSAQVFRIVKVSYTKPDRPEAPAVTIPSVVYTGESFDVSWTESPLVNSFDRRSYNLIFFDSSIKIINIFEGLTQLSANLSNSLNPGTYYVCVTAKNDYYEDWEMTRAYKEFTVVSKTSSTYVLTVGSSTTETSVLGSNAVAQNVGDDVYTAVSVSTPTITSQPANKSVTAGTAATFKVAASGGALSYQWQYSKDGGNTWTNKSGATSDTYKVTAKESYNGIYYRCKVSNTEGIVYSNKAKLTVTSTPKPTITNQPANATVAAGASATFKVVASGTGLTYQWQYSKNGTTWTNKTGATSASYAVTAKASYNGMLYRCIVTNAGGSVTSGTAKLTVTVAKPVITTQPKAATAAVGASATFKVVASGTGLTYQWQYSNDYGATWHNKAGATSASYTVTAKASYNGMLYRCRVKNSGGTVYSSKVRLTVSGVKPKVLSQPKAATAAAGGTATFKVIAAGESMIYQWQYSTNGGTTWKNKTGATSSSYTVTAKASYNGILYRCRVKNSYGTVYSESAVLTVR